VGASGYEEVIATIHFAIDPDDPRNRVIADLDGAPVDASGRVEFSADLHVLRPKDASRANGVALVEVVNRGRKLMLAGFSRGASADPATEADLGDGFLTDQGYPLVWVGWQFDVSVNVERSPAGAHLRALTIAARPSGVARVGLPCPAVECSYDLTSARSSSRGTGVAGGSACRRRRRAPREPR
jgi:hypothetical protein